MTACYFGASFRAEVHTADVLSQAIGGAEDQRVQAALLEGAKEGVHALHADRLCTAHDELQVAEIPLLLLLRRRLPAGMDTRACDALFHMDISIFAIMADEAWPECCTPATLSKLSDLQIHIWPAICHGGPNLGLTDSTQIFACIV